LIRLLIYVALSHVIIQNSIVYLFYNCNKNCVWVTNGSQQRPKKNYRMEGIASKSRRFRGIWISTSVSGMHRERSNVAFDYGDEVVTTGGTGFI